MWYKKGECSCILSFHQTERKVLKYEAEEWNTKVLVLVMKNDVICYARSSICSLRGSVFTSCLSLNPQPSSCFSLMIHSFHIQTHDYTINCLWDLLQFFLTNYVWLLTTVMWKDNEIASINNSDKDKSTFLITAPATKWNYFTQKGVLSADGAHYYLPCVFSIPPVEISRKYDFPARPI